MGRSFSLVVLLLSALGCASSGSPGSTVVTGGPGDNLTCSEARAELDRCAQGAKSDADRCAYAKVIARVCEAAGSPTLAAAAPLTPGSGYRPRSLTTFWREFPGGPEHTGQGDLSANPWSVACSGKSGSELAACLRSRFLPADNPAVCAAYRRAFGVPTCGAPGGGWSRGPSNERFGSALAALNYFCDKEPSFIGSPGRAGGLDCDSTAYEWAALGAFGGESIVTEWINRTTPTLCGNGTKDPGETCITCPLDVGPCCGNGTKDPGETCITCPQDAGLCCGNGTKDPGETCITCPADAGSCCGNGTKDPGETCTTCPVDSQPCPFCPAGQTCQPPAAATCPVPVATKNAATALKTLCASSPTACSARLKRVLGYVLDAMTKCSQ